MIQLSDIQRKQTVQRYLTQQMTFIGNHIRTISCCYHTVDFNVYGYILNAVVLDDYFQVRLYADEFCGLFVRLKKYPCRCTKEKLLQNISLWLEETYLNLDTKFWDILCKNNIRGDYNGATLEIATRHETLTYRAEEVIKYKTENI